MSYEEKEYEELKSLLYTGQLSQYGKRKLVAIIETLISENKELKEENKKLNIIRLEMLLSQFPDSTETYKKYKKELQSLLGKE